MAAGSNWKRPWEDQGGERSQPYPPQSPSSTVPAPQLSVLTPSISPNIRQLPPTQATNVSVSPTSDSQSASYPAKFEPAIEGVRLPTSPYSISTKRPRLDYDQSAPSWRAPQLTGDSTVSNIGFVHAGSLEDGKGSPLTGASDRQRLSQQFADCGPRRRLSEPEYLQRSHIGGNAEEECKSCKLVNQVLWEIASSFMQLRAEILGGITDRRSDDGYSSMPAPDTSRDGVAKSLLWLQGFLQSNIGTARDVVMTQRSQIQHKTFAQGNVSQFVSISHADSAQMDKMKRRIEILEKERDDATKRPQTQPSPLQESFRRSESSPSPSSQDQRRRRSGDGAAPAQGQPLLSVSPSSGYFPPTMQAPPTNIRSLPIAPSPSYPSGHMLPPISSSTHVTQAAHAAHLSDLQHQVSTKSLALQTLQSEHNHLLSAFSRSQTRCATLEKKFQVSDAEINNLTEERNRLKEQCEAYEKQVDDLLEQRDAANKLSIANGGQYTSILQQASRLEIQSLIDRKKWRAEKDEWEREKGGLERRIRQLEEERREPSAFDTKPQEREQGPSRSNTSRRGSAEEQLDPRTNAPVLYDDIVRSSNIDDLRQEILRLRAQLRDLGLTLKEIRAEGHRIGVIAASVGSIGQSVIGKVDSAAVSFGFSVVDDPVPLDDGSRRGSASASLKRPGSGSSSPWQQRHSPKEEKLDKGKRRMADEGAASLTEEACEEEAFMRE